ncbi:hypothetical protein [Lihuaxuella thermophila]|uniref:Uncharacterized protein n=1 Tax=Lihuaxuella thermophila TaxID=1173111 RepID=A0A1H8FDP8_9BACL|nr:hypothetical protein [Lihuaxuella thermophila]SEN29168.1 hypothetical protein SAMN05444955_108118 [Lihuaxuella thermophila]
MLKKTFSILAVLLLSGLLINGITMTQQLKKIHASMEDNIEALEELNQVQAGIIRKNQELTNMLATLDKIDQGLTDTAGKTERTLSLLSTVVDYNADSLRVNDLMVHSSNLSKQQIHTLQSALSQLSPYLTELNQLLKQLSVTAKKDQQHLANILNSTETLNSKTPGVKLK